MPQGPFNLVTQPAVGGVSALNITAATLLKAGSGRVSAVVVNATSTFAVYDSATTAGAGASNLIYQSAASAAEGTTVTLHFPYKSGLVVTPSSGTVSVFYR